MVQHMQVGQRVRFNTIGCLAGHSLQSFLLSSNHFRGGLETPSLANATRRIGIGGSHLAHASHGGRHAEELDEL